MHLLIKNAVKYVDFDVTNMKGIPDATSQEKVKTVDFSKTIAASDLKGGRSRHLIEFIKVGM